MKFLIALMFLSPVTALASINFGDYSLDKNIDWTPLNIKNTQGLMAAFKAPLETSTLTIREFNNIKETSLKKNAASWVKDYTSYGLKIIESTPVKLKDGTHAFNIEAIHKKTNKVFSQMMSIKNRKLITLTCQSDEDLKDFKKCKETLKSFSWKEPTFL